MKKTLVYVLVTVTVILAIIGFTLVGSYNGLVSMKEGVGSSFAQIQTASQRRADLIPGLVETVKGYAAHEKGTFTEITNARSQVNQATNPQDLAKADEQLNQSLGKLMVVVENYPDLKANENFLSLQDEIAGSENRIAVERKTYNDQVRAYNTKVKRFPTNIIAGMFNFESAVYFEADEGADKAPVIDFGS